MNNFSLLGIINKRRPIPLNLHHQQQPRPVPNQQGQTGQPQGQGPEQVQPQQQENTPNVYTEVQVSPEASGLDKQNQQSLLQMQLAGDEFLVDFLS